MASVASLLKSEITRLSKKVVREHIAALQTASTSQRQQLSLLKKQVASLQREVARLHKSRPASASVAKDAGETKSRFVAKGLVSLRKRLGLSAGELGLLLDVSAQTVYNWETKKTTPRAGQLTALAEVRGMGKKQARAKLQELAGKG